MKQETTGTSGSSGGGGVLTLLHRLIVEIKEETYAAVVSIYSFEPTIDILLHFIIMAIITVIFLHGSGLIYRHNKIKRASV